MKMIFKRIFFLGFICCLVLKNYAQLRAGAVSQSSSFSSALNGTTRIAAVNQAVTAVSNGAVINSSMGASSEISNGFGNYFSRNQDILINYSVPDWVLLDRLLLSVGISQQITTLLNQQEEWQNSNLPQSSKQQIIDLLQQQINKLQVIWDALSTSCAPVSFKDYRTIVNADIRYNPPVGGTIGLLPAENGIVNFNNIPYSAIEGNPVKATILIYKK